MRTYELTCIFKTDEDAYTKGKEFVKTLCEKFSSKILKEEDHGVKDLAYEIKKEKKGHYYYLELETAPDSVASMEKEFLLAAPFLKYLFVNKVK